MKDSSIKIRALKGTFNKQIYFNAVIDVSFLSKMKERTLSPEDSNMIFIEDDNYTWDEESSILRIKDISKLEYLLFTGDLDISNSGEELPFVICTDKQETTLFYE